MHNIIKNIGFAIIIIGVLSGLISWGSTEDLMNAVFIIVPAFISGVFFIGFGELLESVNKIKMHLLGEKEQDPFIKVTQSSETNIKD